MITDYDYPIPVGKDFKIWNCEVHQQMTLKWTSEYDVLYRDCLDTCGRVATLSDLVYTECLDTCGRSMVATLSDWRFSLSSSDSETISGADTGSLKKNPTTLHSSHHYWVCECMYELFTVLPALLLSLFSTLGLCFLYRWGFTYPPFFFPSFLPWVSVFSADEVLLARPSSFLVFYPRFLFSLQMRFYLPALLLSLFSTLGLCVLYR
jgi:hypothetical protein